MGCTKIVSIRNDCYLHEPHLLIHRLVDVPVVHSDLSNRYMIVKWKTHKLIMAVVFQCHTSNELKSIQQSCNAFGQNATPNALRGSVN